MPTYVFKNNNSEELFEIEMRISELDQFKQDNPNLTQQITWVNFGNVGEVKTDDGFKEHMSRIAEAHPSSNLAKQYGKKDPTTVKTREAIDKWKSKL